MLPKYAGEDDKWNPDRWNRPFRGSTPVKYYTDKELLDYEIQVNNGLLTYKKSGLPFDSASDSESGIAMFVMNPAGNIYATPQNSSMGLLHHSSLSQGKDISAAGEIMVADGFLLEISNASGHYRPPQKLNTQIFDELETQGMNKDHLNKVIRSGYTKDIGDGDIEEMIAPKPHKDFDDNL